MDTVLAAPCPPHGRPLSARAPRRAGGVLATLLALAALAPAAPLAAAPAAPAPDAPPAVAGAATPAVPAAALPATLRIGSRGAEVRTLQRELRLRGLRIRADGVFGRVTRAALRRVQRRLGLPANGVAGPRTLHALGLAAAPDTPSAAAGAAGTPVATPGPGRSGLVAYALTLRGSPYAYGGESRSGFDCSGFVLHVLARVGVRLPRSSYEQWAAMEPVRAGMEEPGDVVFFHGRGHNGIYIGRGRFVHASRPGTGVRVDRLDTAWYAQRYEGARRSS